MDELIKDVLDNPILKGVTFSGGDPFERAEEFAYMAREFKKHNLNIWSYTGYTFEYMLRNIDEIPGWRDLLECIDVLVDGKFEKNKMQDNLRYRGSTNQRIIDVKESLKNGVVKILDL